MLYIYIYKLFFSFSRRLRGVDDDARIRATLRFYYNSSCTIITEHESIRPTCARKTWSVTLHFISKSMCKSSSVVSHAFNTNSTAGQYETDTYHRVYIHRERRTNLGQGFRVCYFVWSVYNRIARTILYARRK